MISKPTNCHTKRQTIFITSGSSRWSLLSLHTPHLCLALRAALVSTCSSSSLGTGRPPFPRPGMWLCQRRAGSGSVVEGNRQLEANVECEELACVVSGAPSSLTNSGRSEALVRRPWINKPLGMTTRCSHICHHAALDPLRLSRVHRPTSISVLLLHPLFLCFHVSPAVPSILSFIHACMAGRLSGGSACVAGRATEPLCHRGVTRQRGRPGLRPTNLIYLSKSDSCPFSIHSMLVQSN